MLNWTEKDDALLELNTGIDSTTFHTITNEEWKQKKNRTIFTHLIQINTNRTFFSFCFFFHESLLSKRALWILFCKRCCVLDLKFLFVIFFSWWIILETNNAYQRWGVHMLSKQNIYVTSDVHVLDVYVCLYECIYTKLAFVGGVIIISMILLFWRQEICDNIHLFIWYFSFFAECSCFMYMHFFNLRQINYKIHKNYFRIHWSG